MKEIIYNYDNLTEEEITELVIRMKALIIQGDKLLIGDESGCFQFIGGHLEENESFNDCLKREVREETGIELDDSEIKRPFMKVSYLNRDWPEKGKNRKCEIYYYVIETLKEVNLKNTNYTQNEIDKGYSIKSFKLNEAIFKIEENIPNHEKNKLISLDMIEAIKEYLKQCE